MLALVYLAFISLGLPDSLLGSAWPTIHVELGARLSASGPVFMLIAAMTVVSSLLSDRLTRRFGAGAVTAASVALTCAALFGFSLSRAYWMLCLCAIPYGLGAGGVDSALNNYVALRYASRHMSWLHCMWGVGASLGPYIMGAALTAGRGWRAGYRAVGLLQLALAAALILSLPLWKRAAGGGGDAARPGGRALSFREIFAIPGAREMFLCFFCYCALEQTVGLWASSYLARARFIDASTAAGLGSLFFLGVTGGRAAGGFLTLRLSDARMIRLGFALIAAGLALLSLPLGDAAACAGLAAVGLGCAPVYPSFIHATPAHFGAENSQAMIGVQMAFAYAGTCLMPPLFGLLSRWAGPGLLPGYLAALFAAMALLHERMRRRIFPKKVE